MASTTNTFIGRTTEMRRKTQDRRTDDEGQKRRNNDDAVDRQLKDRNDETKTMRSMMRSTGNWRTETTKPTMMRSTGNWRTETTKPRRCGRPATEGQKRRTNRRWQLEDRNDERRCSRLARETDETNDAVDRLRQLKTTTERRTETTKPATMRSTG